MKLAVRHTLALTKRQLLNLWRQPWFVAITVIQIWPVSRPSIVAPKMMLVSSVAAARTTSAASFTS